MSACVSIEKCSEPRIQRIFLDETDLNPPHPNLLPMHFVREKEHKLRVNDDCARLSEPLINQINLMKMIIRGAKCDD